MTHYWTAVQILPRFGYSPKSFPRFKELIRKHSLPVYKRRMPGRSYSVWYCNESMALAYELERCRQTREHLLAEQEAKQGNGQTALSRPRKSASP